MSRGAGFRKVLEEIGALLMPAACVCCGAMGASPVCRDCVRDMAPVSEPFCGRCGRGLPPGVPPGLECLDCRGRRIHFDAARSVFVYKDAAAEVVRAAKYKRIWALTREMSRLMVDYLNQGPRRHGIPVNYISAVVSVAMHPRALRSRGFNQAELMAVRLARELGLRNAGWLRKVRMTAPQAGLDREARRKNVNKAFAAGEEVMGARVMLIDDVYTTGATANECARALKSAGAREVYVLTFARGGFDDEGI